MPTQDNLAELTYPPLGIRPPEEIHLRTPPPFNLPPRLDTGTIETKGAREERQDFTVSSRRLILLKTDLERHPGHLPNWMLIAGVGKEELIAVVNDLIKDMATGSPRHGELRVLLDGMGGHAGGALAAEVGGMHLLYQYHQKIALSQTSQLTAFRKAIDQKMIFCMRKKVEKFLSVVTDSVLAKLPSLLILGGIEAMSFFGPAIAKDGFMKGIGKSGIIPPTVGLTSYH